MRAPSSSRTREELGADYARSLSDFVAGGGEAALVAAYEIGRRAVSMKVGLLELSTMHHAAVGQLAKSESEQSWSLAQEFFAEALSPFELTLRAYHENARLLGLGEALSQRNAEMEHAHRQLRTILDATTAVIYLRGDDEKFLFVNRRFEEVYGIAQSQILGTTGQGIFDDPLLEKLTKSDRATLESCVPQEIEETYRLRDGDATYLALKFPLLDDKDRTPYAVCSVATDISERKRTEKAISDAKEATEAANRALRQAQAQLVQSAKMASLGELVAGIAHEINNPLAFALSHLSTARRKLKRIESQASAVDDLTQTREWHTVRDRLSELSGGLDRIGQLVLRLRTFSRLDEGERKRISVSEAVDSVVTILKHRLESRIVLETRIDEGETLECYPGLLNQALLNLVANAIDAIEGEGRIEISAQARSDDCEICVSDTGGGIPDHVRDRIFDPFFTTKPVGQGTGLGLSITYSIIERHRAQLLVECPQGGGTKMRMVLPRYPGEHSEQERET